MRHFSEKNFAKMHCRFFPKVKV
jgi:hypothetical protein